MVFCVSAFSVNRKKAPRFRSEFVVEIDWGRMKRGSSSLVDRSQPGRDNRSRLGQTEQNLFSGLHKVDSKSHLGPHLSGDIKNLLQSH